MTTHLESVVPTALDMLEDRLHAVRNCAGSRSLEMGDALWRIREHAEAALMLAEALRLLLVRR